jgi:phospholipase C
MENRSFDHFLGWLPGADGRPDLTFVSAVAQTFGGIPGLRDLRNGRPVPGLPLRDAEDG